MTEANNKSQSLGIYYHPDAFVTRRPFLMGRHAAGEGVLGAFLDGLGSDDLVCCADSEDTASHFYIAAAANGQRAGPWVPIYRPDLISERTGSLYIPDPYLIPHAWRRRRFDQRGYSLVGVTHTTATPPVMEMITSLCTTPIQPWDALVCTSNSVLHMVTSMFDDEAAFLHERFGATRMPRPQFPVIPLGVHPDKFVHDPAARASWRQRIGAEEDETVVLYVGRIDRFAKTNPVPMFLALGQASVKLSRPMHLVMSGWFINGEEEKIVRAAAAAACPAVRLHLVDGRDDTVRREIWSVGDIFTLLTDNIQETFGLAPIEAMSAGLPVVVTDWDGYKDTVRDGVDGFRIRTWMPAAPNGLDILIAREAGQLPYDSYVGAVSQFAPIDIAQAAEAFYKLAMNTGLRAQMGAAGAAHVRSQFSWAVVMARYRELFAELAQIRGAAQESAPRDPGREPYPTQPDPFGAFASWPSLHLTTDTRFVLADGVNPALWRARFDLPGAVVYPDVLPTRDEMFAILGQMAASNDPRSAGELVATADPARRVRVFRGLSFMMKIGILRTV